MSAKLKELQEKRGTLAKTIKDLADKQDSWTAEDRQNWDVLNADYDKFVKDELEPAVEASKAEEAQRAAVDARLAALNSHRDHQPAARNPRIGRDGGSLADGPVNADRFLGGQPSNSDQRALALQAWLRVGGDPHDVGEITEAHRTAAQACGVTLNHGAPLRIGLHENFRAVRNALSGHSETAGGYTYGDTFIANLEQAMLAWSGMFQVSEVIRTASGEPMRWPTADDTSNTGAQLGENTSIGSSVEPTFGQVVWNAYKFSSKPILVPFELLRDNAVNLAQVLSDMLGVRLARIQNTKYTTGQGNAGPKGIVTCATAGVTSASSTAIAYDELIDLEHSLDPSRRAMPGVGYMFHDSILKALRKLKDGESRYLWQAGANTGAPDTLNQRPYTINQDMASSIAQGNITVIFGQLTAYKIRQVNAIRLYRLQERYRDTDQDGFIAFMEGDGNLLDAGDHPVKKLTQV